MDQQRGGSGSAVVDRAEAAKLSVVWRELARIDAETDKASPDHLALIDVSRIIEDRARAQGIDPTGFGPIGDGGSQDT